MDGKASTHDRETHGRSNDIDESTPPNKVKAPNVFERAKEEIQALVEVLHPKKDEKEVDTIQETVTGTDGSAQKNKIHHRETHGTSQDIDKNTPISKVKGPNIFERAKEEIEALVDAIHPKKGED